MADFGVEADFLGEAFFAGVLLGVAAFLGRDFLGLAFFAGVFLGLAFFAGDFLAAAGVFINSAMPSILGVSAF